MDYPIPGYSRNPFVVRCVVRGTHVPPSKVNKLATCHSVMLKQTGHVPLCTLKQSMVGVHTLCRKGFRFWVSGFGFRVSVFGLQVPGFGSRVSIFGFRVSVFGFRVSVLDTHRFHRSLQLITLLPLRLLPPHLCPGRPVGWQRVCEVDAWGHRQAP